MAFRVKIVALATTEMKKRFGDLSEAEHRLALYAKKTAEPYVPARTGQLARQASVSGNVVRYPSPQAHALYVGKRVSRRGTSVPLSISRSVHPQAQSFWFWAAKKDHMTELRREATELVKKELKIK